MTELQLTEARNFLNEQFLTDKLDVDRFLDLRERLHSDPDSLWDLWFHDPQDNPFRAIARRLMAKYGPNLTMGEAQELLRKEASRLCRTLDSQKHPRRRKAVKQLAVQIQRKEI